MTTMTQLVDSALAEVYGTTQTQDVNSYLMADVTATDLTLTVASAANFSRGLVQVGDELLIVDSVARDTGVLTLGHVSGRGVQGTTATTHAAGDRVVMSPSISRAAAVRAVEETIRSSSGLFATAVQTHTLNAAVSAYSVPATATDVLDVAWFPPGPSGQWLTVRRWTFDRFNDAVVVNDAVVPGQQLKITYAIDPTVPTQAQDFTVTGLPASCLDVIRLGAVWRLITSLEPHSLLTQSVEADAMDRQLTPGSRLRVAQFAYQVYRQRLDEEVRGLQNAWPMRIHFGGSR